MPPPRGAAATEDWQVAYAQLDGRIEGLRGSVEEAVAAIRGLANKIEDRARPQWQALGVALSFVLAVGGLVYWPLVNTQQRIEGVIGTNQTRTEASISKLAETAVSKEDFLLITNAAKERRDDAQRSNESRFTRVEKDIDGLQTAVVARGEIQEKWDAQRQRDADIQRQIDEARAQLRDLYSPRDAIATLQHQVEELDRRLMNAKSEGAAPR